MGFLTSFRRKKRKHNEEINSESDNASVAKAVLAFLELGLMEGVESITKNYKPAKVEEFVTVSGEILRSLKRGYENKFPSDVVVMSMKVNNHQKQVELIQLGRDLMLSLNTSTHIITSATLTDIYANLRNDMIEHPEVYGKELYLMASSFPDPTKQL